MRVKIISTFHNRQPHEFRNRFCDKLLFSMTFRCANKIIILSSDSKPILIEKFGESILRKTILVPHPSYNCTPKSQILKSRNFKVLFFGNLRPYKNIELIFEIAKRHPDTIFTIAGNPIDEKYKFELIRASDHLANIRLIPHLLSDAEIDELIEENSIMLLPYSTESSLNSGVVIHAICKGINVIVPSIGTVNQLNNKNDVFSYTYQSYDEHIEQLSKMLSLAKEEYINNYEKFVNRISRLYNEVSSNQSPVSISPQLKQVFQ